MSLQKTCSKCSKEYPLSDYFVTQSNADGRYSWCRNCHNEWTRDYRKKRGKRTVTCSTCGQKTKKNLSNSYAKNASFCCDDCLPNRFSILDYTKTLITPELLAWIDGLIISDGHITAITPNQRNSKLQWGVKHEEFARFIGSVLNPYLPKINPWYPTWKGERKTMWRGRTLFHPDLTQQRHRWYKNGKKIIPSDIVITPQLLYMWYLGDGSICKSTGLITLSTDCFTCTDQEMVTEKIFQKYDIKFKIQSIYRSRYDRTYHYMKINAKQSPEFLKIIGQNLVRCYDYKFDIPSCTMRSAYRFVTISKNRTKFPQIKAEDLAANLISKWKDCPDCSMCGIPTTAVDPENRTCSTRVVWDEEHKQVCCSCKKKKEKRADVPSLTSLTEKSAYLFVAKMRTKFPEIKTKFPLDLTTNLISKWKDCPDCSSCGIPTTTIDPTNRTCPTRVVWTENEEHKQVCYSCKKKERGKRKRKMQEST